MSFFGNIFSHYNYSTTDIEFNNEGNKVYITSKKSGLQIEIKYDKAKTALPSHSPFKDWKEARRYAGPMPFTFTYNNATKKVLIIEGVREAWIPKSVSVIKDNVAFLDDKNFNGIVLANAFIIENVPYYWKKGRTEIWKG